MSATESNFEAHSSKYNKSGNTKLRNAGTQCECHRKNSFVRFRIFLWLEGEIHGQHITVSVIIFMDPRALFFHDARQFSTRSVR